MINILSDEESVFKKPELQEMQKKYLQKCNGNSCKYTETLSSRDLIWERKAIAQIILYNSSTWRDLLKKEDEDIAARQEQNPYDDSPIEGIWVEMDEFITKGTMNQIGKKTPDYYKNFMNNDDQEEFAIMMDFFKSELIHYSLNLTYVKKIVPALEEYRKKGYFPSKTLFLNHYVSMAVLDMVLMVSKLFSITAGEKNFCFDYLKGWLEHNYHNETEVRDVLQNKDLKALMKSGRKYRDCFENLRNRYLAHYDPHELDVLSKFSVDIKTLEDIYELCVRVVKMLSFKYFELHETYSSIIEHNGFESIFQNPWVSQVEKCDLDEYLELLKKMSLNKE
jgi:hypothetical protein